MAVDYHTRVSSTYSELASYKEEFLSIWHEAVKQTKSDKIEKLIAAAIEKLSLVHDCTRDALKETEDHLYDKRGIRPNYVTKDGSISREHRYQSPAKINRSGSNEASASSQLHSVAEYSQHQFQQGGRSDVSVVLPDTSPQIDEHYQSSPVGDGPSHVEAPHTPNNGPRHHPASGDHAYAVSNPSRHITPSQRLSPHQQQQILIVPSSNVVLIDPNSSVHSTAQGSANQTTIVITTTPAAATPHRANFPKSGSNIRSSEHSPTRKPSKDTDEDLESLKLLQRDINRVYTRSHPEPGMQPVKKPDPPRPVTNYAPAGPSRLSNAGAPNRPANKIIQRQLPSSPKQGPTPVGRFPQNHVSSGQRPTPKPSLPASNQPRLYQNLNSNKTIQGVGNKNQISHASKSKVSGTNSHASPNKGLSSKSQGARASSSNSNSPNKNNSSGANAPVRISKDALEIPRLEDVRSANPEEWGKLERQYGPNALQEMIASATRGQLKAFVKHKFICYVQKKIQHHTRKSLTMYLCLNSVCKDKLFKHPVVCLRHVLQVSNRYNGMQYTNTIPYNLIPEIYFHFFLRMYFRSISRISNPMPANIVRRSFIFY